MICQWDMYLSILPSWMRSDVDHLGRTNLMELRLRLSQPPQLVTKNGCREVDGCVTSADLQYVINAASRYSPWAADSLKRGYITGPGGHRIGVCGQVIRQQDMITGIRDPVSLCIRTARDFPGISRSFRDLTGSVLMIGPPGGGKTTLLRDLIRQKSGMNQGSVGVVDEREELFPSIKGKWAYAIGPNTDVMSRCGKREGIEILLRTMSPRWIAVDEISSEEDCDALWKAGWCGVSLIATAHAENLDEFLSRPVYRPIVSKKLFDWIVCLNREQNWTLERMRL